MKRTIKKSLVFILCLCTVLSCGILNSATVFAADSTVVNIPDVNFKAALNRKLGVSNLSASITRGQMASITSFYVYISNETYDYKKISNLTGAEYLTNIKTLSMKYTSITTLKNIASCSKLTSLDVNSCNKLTDISAIKNLTSLTNLDISRCEGITTISPLSSLNKLQYLYMEGTGNVKDLTPIKNKKSLIYLDLEKVVINDSNKSTYMAAVSSLTNLKTLIFAYSGVKDEYVSMLDNLVNLERLILGQCDITNVNFVLKHKAKLTSLTVYGNKISDLSPLKQLPNLTSLGWGSNNVADYSFINSLPNLSYTGDRWAEGDKDFANYQSYYVNNGEDIKILDNTLDNSNKTYTFKNPIKNENGKVIAPEKSDAYTYNATNNTIKIKDVSKYYLDNIVSYSFNIKTKQNTDIVMKVNVFAKFKYITLPAGEIYSLSLSDGKTSAGNQLNLSSKITSRGDDDVTYQWYKNGKAINDAVNKNYSISSCAVSDTGSYYLEVSNQAGTIKTNTINVTVADKPSVTISPAYSSLFPNTYVKITSLVHHNNDRNLTYQWYKDGKIIAGANGATYTIQSSTLQDWGVYTLKVTNGIGTTESNKSSLLVGDVNSDKVFNTKDIVVIQRYLVRAVVFNNDQLKMADINGDKKINMYDVVAMQQHLAGK